MADYNPDGKLPQVTDLLLKPSNFITDTDKIRDACIADLLRLDPNYHVIDQRHPLHDPEYANRWFPIEVSNGIRSDVRTFPVSVVNCPVENYPPVVQLNITRKAFFLGEESNYAIKFADPDCFIFSLAQLTGRTPSTSHLPMLPGNRIREDQDRLIYRMSLNGYLSYQYGPGIEDMIGPPQRPHNIQASL